MAEKKVVAEKKAKKVVAYYRSRISGLKVIVGGADSLDPTMIEYVRFTPIKERFAGEIIKVGYLKTDNAVAIKKLANDANVEKIEAADYNKALKLESEVEEVQETE